MNKIITYFSTSAWSEKVGIGWTEVRTEAVHDECLMKEIDVWCENNLSGTIVKWSDMFLMEDDADVMAFKLRWL